MRAEITLRVDGNARVVTIPRPLLVYLGWLTGQKLVCELDESCQRLVIRPFTRDDVPSSAHPRITYELPFPERR